MTLKKILFVLLLLFSSENLFAKLVLSAPPREKPAAGEKFYGPIAKQLSKILNEKVVYVHPKSWVRYTKEMRAGNYDIVFDGPHFVAWRMNHVNHEPLARLSGSLRFYVLGMKEDVEMNSMLDVLSSRPCGLASPNLGTVSLFDLFKNPIVQPEIHIISGSMHNVMQRFMSGGCRTVVVRDKLFNKLPSEQKNKVRIIAKSKSMPNQAISVSKRISRPMRKKITAFLVSKEGAKAAENLLERYSKTKKFFIRAKKNEFKGLEQLLEGVVYGW